MSRLTVTAEELADVKREWTGDELFKLSNAQLHEIIVARGLVAEGDANKKALVKTILDGKSEGDLEVEAQNKDAATSTFSAGRMSGGDPVEDAALAGAEVDVRFNEAKINPPAEDNMLIGSDKFDAMVDIGGGATAQLGSIVANAQAASGLNVREWNALDGDDRDQYIEAAIVAMKRSVEEAPKTEPLPTGRMDELDAKRAESEARGNFKGMFAAKQRQGSKFIAEIKDGAKEAETLHGHIDDLPNPLLAKG